MVCIENHVDIKITAGGVWGKKKAPRRALFAVQWGQRLGRLMPRAAEAARTVRV